MKIFLVILINIVFGVIQTSFFSGLVNNLFVPNLILILAFSLMYKDLNELSLMSAFVGGLILDLLGFNIIGLSSLAMVGSLYLFSIIRRHVSKSWFTNLLVFSAALTVYDIVLGSLATAGLWTYAAFVLVMFFVSVILASLVESILSYLHRVGVDLTED